MPEETAGTQDVPENTGAASETEDGADDSALNEATFDAARAKSLIDKLRGEVKAGKATARDLAAAQTKLKDIEAAKLTDQQKLEQRVQELETENGTLKTQAQRGQAERAAASAGAVHPDLIADRIPAEALTDKKALDAKIAELRTQYPALFRAANGSGDGGAGGSGGSGKTMNDLIREGARR